MNAAPGFAIPRAWPGKFFASGGISAGVNKKRAACAALVRKGGGFPPPVSATGARPLLKTPHRVLTSKLAVK
jgi:hypothetical protein